MSLTVTDLHAGYVPDAPILNGVGLTVESASILTIIGPNGSGKSTLLKSIMGYLKPSTGRIEIDGQSMEGVPVHQRPIKFGVAYVPQLENVFGGLTVKENLELGGARLKARERRRRVDELLGIYPALAERKRQRADAQSGGERQMLAVARALMTRPKMLLLDEPSAGLSPLMTQRLFEMLSGLRDRDDVTILIVEQNATQSLNVSDRGVVLALGTVVAEGKAETLLSDADISAHYLGGGQIPEPQS